MDTALKPGVVSSPVPLLPPWLAFVCAGVCTVVAGYLAGTVQAWTRAYMEFGVELPYATQFVVDAGALLPVGLVLAAALVVAAPAVRVSSPRARELRPLASLLAVGAAGAAGVFLWTLVLVFYSVQSQLQY